MNPLGLLALRPSPSIVWVWSSQVEWTRVVWEIRPDLTQACSTLTGLDTNGDPHSGAAAQAPHKLVTTSIYIPLTKSSYWLCQCPPFLNSMFLRMPQGSKIPFQQLVFSPLFFRPCFHQAWQPIDPSHPTNTKKGSSHSKTMASHNSSPGHHQLSTWSPSHQVCPGKVPQEVVFLAPPT